MLRVAFYINGDKQAAEQNFIKITEKTSKKSNTIIYIVKDDEKSISI